MSTKVFFPELATQSSVGDRIRRARRRRGLTQERLAGMVGVHRVVICTWERSHHIPQIASLRKLQKALGCSLTELIGK